MVVCGLPGAGKTTLAVVLEDDLQAVRFSADDWLIELSIDLFDAEARERVERMQWHLCERLLTLGQRVIVEWGTWGRAERDYLRERARALGGEVELHFVDAPLDFCGSGSLAEGWSSSTAVPPSRARTWTRTRRASSRPTLRSWRCTTSRRRPGQPLMTTLVEGGRSSRTRGSRRCPAGHYRLGRAQAVPLPSECAGLACLGCGPTNRADGTPAE